MKNTTLCYIEKDGSYLMIRRRRPKGDGNDGKWLGIGGHFEENEDPFDCIRREVKEETGLTLIRPRYRGLVTFVSDKYETEMMHLFSCTEFEGELTEGDEGELCFIEKSRIGHIPLWEGDLVFLSLLDTRQDFFCLKLEYEGDGLKGYTVY